MSSKTVTIIKLPEGSFLGIERDELDATTFEPQTLYRVRVVFGNYTLSVRTFLSAPEDIGLKTIEAMTEALSIASKKIHDEQALAAQMLKSHVAIMSEKLRKENSRS